MTSEASSAELSEAINSMYRWYENAQVCYAYLHGVPDPWLPTARDHERYPNSNGWPEWFSRGWTLQELLAPSNVQFLNKNWKSIGGKETLAPTLVGITGIPEHIHILIHGLHGNRPYIAQIMPWAAHRTTTRVEDSLFADGSGGREYDDVVWRRKKAFHRLQLEIIRASNVQRIFSWEWDRKNKQPGSILADDPRFFEDCGRMELMGHDEFMQSVEEDVLEEELDSIEDRLGTFPSTKRSIQIWIRCPAPPWILLARQLRLR